MIVGSVLLVIVAGVLLGFGLVRLDAALLYSSIGVSALAALTLAVGLRRVAAVRAGRGTIAVRPVVRAVGPTPAVRPGGRAAVSPSPDGDGPAPPSARAGADPVGAGDEPAPEAVGAPDLARAGRLDATVAVVDRHPRFHRVECAYLLGRPAETLPVARAIESGFTPCGRCRPVTTLLADRDTAAGGPGD